MKHLLTSLMLLCGLLANAADNYLVTTDGTTYPIDSPADFESENHSTSEKVSAYYFTSNNKNITVERSNVKSVTLEIPLTNASGSNFCTYLFYSCTNLTEANVTFSDEDECTSVGNYFCYSMFEKCSGLVSLPDSFNLPQDLTEVGNYFCAYMFNSCSGLVSLPDDFNLPQGITSVGNAFCNYMFFGCSKLSAGETVELKFPFDATKAFYETSYATSTGTESAVAGATYYLKGNSEVYYTIKYYDQEGTLLKTEHIEIPEEGETVTIGDEFAVDGTSLVEDTENDAFRYWTYGEDGSRAYKTDVIEDNIELYPHITAIEKADGETTYEYVLDDSFDYDDHDCISISDNTITLTVGPKAYVVIEASSSVSASVVDSETLESLSEGKYAYYYEGDAEAKITISDATNISQITIYNVADQTLTFSSGGLIYTITDGKNVEITGVEDNVTSVKISTEVVLDDITFTVTSIAKDAFSNLDKLTLIVSSYIPFEETPEFKNGFKGILICNEDDVKADYIGNGWGEYFAIEGDTFEYSDLYYQILSVSLEEGEENTVELIADASYSNLTSITIPTSVEHTNFTFTVASIADGAFAKATNLTSVTVSWEEPLEINESGVFASVEGATLYIELPEDSEVEEIERTYAKSNWANYFTIDGYIEGTEIVDEENGLTYKITDQYENEVKIVAFACAESVTIPVTVTYEDIDYTIVASDAVFACDELKEVTMSASEPPFDVSAFEGIPDGVVLNVGDNQENYASWHGTFIIYGYVETGDQFELDGIKYQVLSETETVEIVGATASEITIVESVTYNGLDFTVTNIASGAFDDQSGLTVTVSFTDPTVISLGTIAEGNVGTLKVTEGYEWTFYNSAWAEYFTIDGTVSFTVGEFTYTILEQGSFDVELTKYSGEDGSYITISESVTKDGIDCAVISIAVDAFEGYDDLEASVNFIDPATIAVSEDYKGGKVGSLVVPDGCKDIYVSSSWYKYFDIDGEDYFSQDGLVYYTFIITYYDDEEESESTNKALKATSSKYSISLEVAYVDESASEVTIPRTIDLGDDSSTSYEVTSMNADALKDCKDLVTINLEASIPAEDIEALNKVPDSVTIVLDEDELGTEYCESVKAAATIAGIEVKMVNTAIVEVKIATDKVELERYNLLGQRISAPQRGINIIKYSDGTVEKVLVK